MEIQSVVANGFDDFIKGTLTSWGIQSLTVIQQRALDAGVIQGESIFVSAPTSSGKTLVGELAALAGLRNGRQIIYLVSHKALADQKYLDFRQRFGEEAPIPLASVGLSTGDREEGDVDAQFMIATYEKALGLLLAGQLRPNDSVVIADELQILREDGRGPEIETLCSALRQRGIGQFIALTATVENAEDLAGWMECKMVSSSHRDIPLHQEIWFNGQAHATTFGQEQGELVDVGGRAPFNVEDVVSKLLELDRGPILVFTETRREATQLAESFSQRRPKQSRGIELSNQLELFSEPTESSNSLRANAERHVTFHTADLSPQERQVIERGISEGDIDVCFATTTLAAGVNFPFRTILFWKLTYEYFERKGTRIARWDYRNMSGRAGRLGMHEKGYAIILPKNQVELGHANQLVLPENDRLESRYFSVGLRKTILSLLAAGLADSLESVMGFFRNTLYWYQTLETNPVKLQALEAKTIDAINWLLDHRLITKEETELLVTPFGAATASTGLLPSTTVQFARILEVYRNRLEDAFEDAIPGLIHAAVSSEEFIGKHRTRFLTFQKEEYESLSILRGLNLLVRLDPANLQVAQCAHAILLFSQGEQERKIAYRTNITSGNLHRLSNDVAWVLEGLQKLSCVPEFQCSQNVTNHLAMLSRMVRWGAPPEALDVLRIAQKHQVPGLGRQRAMALVAQGITTLKDVLTISIDKLTSILRHQTRAEALVQAVSSVSGITEDRLKHAHSRVAKSVGVDELVNECNTQLGTPYEAAIAALLREEPSWVVTEIDDGKRQNDPDLMVQLGTITIIIECKTTQKKVPLIGKEEAWAVLQKAADYDRSYKRVTLGKPQFDETCKKKVAGAHDITLIEHNVFIEGVLRVLLGSLSAQSFLEWLGQPGLSDLQRLGGKPTYKE
ncbi:DEAD/DEAH box helicase [Methylomonas sp. OY6]|uniref:DEAD/DEAH box helicase n=1 Tax=Methylomonas defluvii TaxID=3045149 RepID=A0ABU4UGZ0_9GAMM|nr:DEAD/DEAH box helicase [Methylomonas sp. OY6]MDX8128749.1 DEAD/DEAH box helicase [Methylomonas sp. OY6]